MKLMRPVSKLCEIASSLAPRNDRQIEAAIATPRMATLRTLPGKQSR